MDMIWINGENFFTLKQANLLYQEQFDQVSVRDGVFNVVLGDAKTLNPSVFDGEDELI